MDKKQLPKTLQKYSHLIETFKCKRRAYYCWLNDGFETDDGYIVILGLTVKDVAGQLRDVVATEKFRARVFLKSGVKLEFRHQYVLLRDIVKRANYYAKAKRSQIDRITTMAGEVIYQR